MVNQGEIEGRLDADFYLPDFLRLEKQVKTKTSKTLNDYILSMAGGATPLKENKEYYTEDKENGIPFLRVQNLSTDSTLILEDCKYITEAVHETMLKRSQVSDQDLLVKITGVGRMAIASVPPEGFVGNTNQHMVVIKTGSRKTSLQLAYWLNTDIAEKLATRRAGGGTRPALDYEALKSIPVIDETHIVELMQDAHATKQSKEAEATALRQSIDAYVLEQLGITLPTVEKRLFFGVCSSQVEGSRLDPNGYSSFPQKLSKSLHEALYPAKPLQKIIVESFSGDWGEEPFKEEFAHLEKIKVLRNTNFDNKDNLDLSDVAIRSFEKVKVLKKLLQQGDILVEKSGGSPTQPVGRVAHVDKGEESYLFSNFLSVIRLTPSVNTFYIFVFLKVLYRTGLTEYMQNQTTGIKNLLWNDFVDIQIPLPPPPLQNAIAEEVQARLTRAKQLESEAKLALASAKADVERLLFGEASSSP